MIAYLFPVTSALSATMKSLAAIVSSMSFHRRG
jgi:hypothetical protein